MATSIQITQDLQQELAKRKLSERDTYEEVIWDLIEDTAELSEETKRDMEEARAEFKQGQYKTLSQLKKELGIK